MPFPFSGRGSGLRTDKCSNQLEDDMQFGEIDRQLLGVVLDDEFVLSRVLRLRSVT